MMVNTSLHRRAASALFAVLSTSILLSACGGGGSSSSTGGSGNNSVCNEFDCQAMVTNLATNIMLPAQQQFAAQAAELSTAVGNYCAALGSESVGTAKAAAQQAWQDSMALWQAVEVMQVGPLTDNGGALRDTLYSWPVVSRCGVDQDIVLAESQGDAYDISTRTPDRRGLDALEYVLFTPTLTHSCAANITALQSWNDRPEVERAEARCQYAVAVAADITEQAGNLVAQWDGTQGNYLAELTQPGSGSRYATIEAAVNALSDALFYVEKQVKDHKLAEPLGLKPNSCGTSETGCAAAVESPLSATSKANIRTNLVTLQTLYSGNVMGAEAHLGFDDFLDAAGDSTTSAGMLASIADAISAIDNIPGSLASAVETDYNAVSNAHGALKVVTDRLKSDFLTVLGLSIPGSAAGDGD